MAAYSPPAGGVAPPTITSLNYSLGDIAGGGQAIVITGTNLAGATNVRIGGIDVTPSSSTSTTCTFALPAHAAGTVTEVAVTTPGGTSATTSFTFWSPLNITGIDTHLDANKSWNAGTGVWTDQNSARTWSPGSAPTQTASVFGSLPSLRFTQATPNYLVASTPRNFHLTGGSAFFVYKTTTNDTTATNPNFNAPLNAIGWTGGWSGFGLSGGLVDLRAFNSAGSSSMSLLSSATTVNDGVARMIGCTSDSSGNAAIYHAATSLATSAANLFYGCDLIGGGYNTTGAADGWDGDIGAVILVSGVISGADLTKLNNWARQRFGTP